jgi:antitoxin MazE
MKTRLVQIGNARGIRLPKAVIEEAQLGEGDVEVKAEPGCVVIRSARRPRMGWAELARHMAERGEDRLMDPPASTRFDREEWEWQ